jgi:hypothetical protein
MRCARILLLLGGAGCISFTYTVDPTEPVDVAVDGAALVFTVIDHLPAHAKADAGPKVTP